MALYNRIRIIVLNSARHQRDVAAAQAEFDHVFVPMGAKYSGYCIEQGAIRHFYMIDEPTDEQLAELFKISRTTAVSMIREYKGMNPISYDIEAIVADVARVLRDQLLSDQHESLELARCWSGVKVLETLARA